MSYKQLYAGFNGPQNPDSFAFASANMANSSWLKSAMGDHLEQVLSQVDFDHQVLVVAAVGERPTATGKLEIRKIDEHDSIFDPYVLIGVNDNECAMPGGRSFPFVIAVVERPKLPPRAHGGFDYQNFPDGCKPILSGDAHNTN